MEAKQDAEEREELLPARMLNEYVYCPRLFALEHVHGEWADSSDTVQGRTVHRRVDEEGGELPPPEEDPERPTVARSVYLSDAALGVVAKIDLVEARASADGPVEVLPVDYKKGAAPDLPEGAWPPERVQVCVQGLLLRAHGYACDRGMLYFAASRRRVEVPFDDDLVALTLRSIAEARALAARAELPPPLVESGRCVRCSLVGICLPDEQNLLTEKTREVRPMIPPRDDGVPLYVQLQGGSLGKDHEEIVVKDRGTEVGRARIADTSRVVLLGNISVTTPLLNELAQADVPVSYHSYTGWFQGIFRPASGHNVMTRIAQHRVFQDRAAALSLARSFVASKIRNCRVLLRRNAEELPQTVLDLLAELADEAAVAPSHEVLLGKEGAAARFYFENLPRMIRGDLRETFRFDGRNRRPPRDPVNAMLSFSYAMIVRELTGTLHGIGLDPYVGFLHQPRYGRPSLALDLMEEFRPVICDSVVINAVNNGVVQARDFLIHPTGVALTPGGRKKFIQVFERRLDEMANHPTFNTRLSYRRILEVQARLLGKVLRGELPSYPEYRVR